MGRIDDKINDIFNYIEELRHVLPKDYKEYQGIIEKRLACERAFEKIIEATNNLAILFIKDQRLILPTEDEKAFDILARANITTNKLALKLKQTKGMRNILIHQYDNLDNEIIFNAISREIINNVEEFVKNIERQSL